MCGFIELVADRGRDQSRLIPTVAAHQPIDMAAPAPLTDEVELLVRAAAGEPTAVRQLLDDAGPVLYGFVFARVGGDRVTAEDLVQETLLEAVRSAATFRGESALTTWMCAIARRRLARFYEQERRADVARAELTVVGEETGDDEVHEIEDRDEMIRALGRLPALHRHVLVLKYLDDRSVGEIATDIGRSAVQVQSLLQRARQGLRRQLEEPA
jgi:RNA polymerase sigma-70 factor (ECF subfamily)